MSAFAEQADQGTSIGALVGAVVAAAAVYVVVLRWFDVPAQAPVAIPILYTLTVGGALLLVVLLQMRARVIASSELRWVAAGFAAAGTAALLQAVPLLESATGGLVQLTPTGAAGLYLIWHAVLPLFVLGALYAPHARQLRRGLLVATAAAMAAALIDPGWSRLPRLVATDGTFTWLYRSLLAVLVVAGIVVAVAWTLRIGRHPTRPQAWIAVGLWLAVLDAALGTATGQLFAPAWWASASLRAGQFLLPAAGLLADTARLLTLLRQHEQALSARLYTELHSQPHRPAAPDQHVATRIRDVIDRHRFHPVFQPIYSLSDGRLVAVEALTRFDTDPPRTPDVWFADAEQVGLAVELESATLAAALAAATQLHDEVTLSVNLSPAATLDPGIHQQLINAGRPITIEITEHAIVDDYPRLNHALQQLRRHGIRLAVDDAGSGFASLRHIVRLAPDIIKLDRSLTAELHLDPIRRALARALVDFATETGTTLIAEGVETLDELTSWQQLGAHAAQGYLLARPGPLPPPDATQPLAATTSAATPLPVA